MHDTYLDFRPSLPTLDYKNIGETPKAPRPAYTVAIDDYLYEPVATFFDKIDADKFAELENDRQRTFIARWVSAGMPVPTPHDPLKQNA